MTAFVPDVTKKQAMRVYCVLVTLLAVMLVVETLGFGHPEESDFVESHASGGDTAWAPYRVGSEHAQLLLAAETGAAAATLKLHGDLFLGAVDQLRQAPPLRALTGGSHLQMAALDDAVQATVLKLANLGSSEGLEALRQQLLQDAALVRDTMMTLSELYRKEAEEERAYWAESVDGYLDLMKLLHAALLVAMLGAGWIGWQFIRTARERDRKNATQDSILRAVDEGILGIDPQGDVVFFNARANELLGNMAVLDRPLPLSARGEQMLLSHVRSLISDRGGPVSAEVPVSSRFHVVEDGVTRHYSLSLTSSREACWGRKAGACGLRVVTIRDVSVEVEAARQGVEYENRICEVRRVMTYAVITGGIIHEINQPLSAIRNYLHVLKKAPEFAEVGSSSRRIVSHLGDEVNRISDIIQNVRALGPQEAKLDGSCYVSEAVARSVRLLSLGITPPPSVSIKTAASSDLRVKGSLPLIGQVIINLVRNALQASAAAGDSGAVVFLRELDGFAEISVADFGVGVSPEAAASMFEPFCQSEGGGMGLGLAICQRIAANLGGSISWENREAGGTLFKFMVPLAGKEQAS